MKVAFMLGAVLGVCLPAVSAASEAAPSGIQPYSSVFHPAEKRWQLIPVGGPAVEIRHPDDHCAASPPPPVGLWLVTPGTEGRLELLAPSSTALPAGHDGRIRLTPCGESDPGHTPQLALPAVVIDMLAAHGGVVLITD